MLKLWQKDPRGALPSPVLLTPSLLLPLILRVTHPVLSSWCCHSKVLQAGWLAAAEIYVCAVPEKSGKVSPAFLALNLLEGTLFGLTHPVSMVPHVCGLVAIPPQALPPSSLAPALLCESFFHSSHEDMSVGIGPIRQCKVFQGEIALTDSECWDTGTKFSGSTLTLPLFFLDQLHKPGTFLLRNFIDAFWLSDFLS